MGIKDGFDLNEDQVCFPGSPDKEECGAGGQNKDRRYFRIAGITVCVESELDLETFVFNEELMAFAVEGPGDDNVILRHYFTLPDLEGADLGKELYRDPPWAIYRKDGRWIYRGILPGQGDKALHQLAVFNAGHTRGRIYNPPKSREMVLSTGWHSLALFPTDQIWLGPLLADRQAVLLHSSAAIINGGGFIFVGHSDAGKSTTIELIKTAQRERGLDSEILCDDRNILRLWPDGWRVHGTWSHGDIAEVSPAGAPLTGVFFLEQTPENEIVPLTDRRLIWQRLLATMVRPMVSAAWWQKELDILEQLVSGAAFYRMCFDKSGAVLPELERLTR